MTPSFELESQYPNDVVFGLDEAGLGPLAGPIVVASCHIEGMSLPDELINNINDSKKLSHAKREYLFEIITQTPNIKYGIAIINNELIETRGLSEAWKTGVVQSVNGLNPSVCLIDGIRRAEIPHCQVVTVVKGDQKSFSIATASILAKVTRDRIMYQIHEEYPEYGFDKHVGYGTKLHMDKLRELGPCKYHRKNYAPVRSLMENASDFV